MVLIQHTLTRRYLQSFAEWSLDLRDAWVFASTAEAVNFCEWWGLGDIQIVVAGEDQVDQFPISACRPVLPLQRERLMPIVLPRMDSRPN